MQACFSTCPKGNATLTKQQILSAQSIFKQILTIHYDLVNTNKMPRVKVQRIKHICFPNTSAYEKNCFDKFCVPGT